ncbi:MAG: hypothetical protein GY805_27965 [Chloroflexi bacterium]|nr:hypothetical protein [Chloroflexota bacterium]
MGKLNHDHSEGLQAAQQRLMRLRAQLGTGRLGADERLSPLFERDAKPSATATAVSQLPPHLGWESATITQTLRQTPTTKKLKSAQITSSEETAVPPPHPSIPKTVKVYPDIAIGLLRQEQVAVGRLWLLLQVADGQGRGWLAEKEMRKLFSGKRSSLRFCGVRQLRNLLVRGDGFFWTRENGRIWLRSALKLAFALDISRLHMRPVAVPVRVLRQKIGTVRAHLYATFHSSRTKSKRANNPIARETVANITQVLPRTQRRYDRKAKVKQQPQFAIGGQATVENQQLRGWQQGRATFLFKDFKGKQGQVNNNYVAWQLPNSYVGPHAQLPKGRQKRINRALTDLFMQGMTGNDQRSQSLGHHFFGNGRLASKAYARNPKDDHYWRGQGNGRCQLWQVIEGQK